jgi:RNase P protein component
MASKRNVGGKKMTRTEFRRRVEEAMRLYERGALTKEQVQMIARHYQLSRQIEWDTKGE